MIVQCNFCGYRQQTRGRKDFKCRWCGHRIVIKQKGAVKNDR